MYILKPQNLQLICCFPGVYSDFTNQELLLGLP